MKVFVSSVVAGYEEYRHISLRAIDAEGHTPVVMETTSVASPETPQVACLDAIEGSDVVVFLLGKRYGHVQSSGMSATHEEWEHARAIGKKVLVFKEDVDIVESEQVALLEEVEDWVDGRFRTTFSDDADLAIKLVAALNGLGAEGVESTGPEFMESLPPFCQKRIEEIQQVAPRDADRVMGLLANHGRVGTRLGSLVADPPGWLKDAGSGVWEAIAGWMSAYEMEGVVEAQRRAIEAGSQRGDLFFFEQAIAAAIDGKRDQAEVLFTQVTDGHPCAAAVQFLISGDPQATVRAVLEDRLHVLGDHDQDTELLAINLMAWGYWETDSLDRALTVLRDANLRHPNKPDLLWKQAEAALFETEKIGRATGEGRELLQEAATVALQARDCFRQWKGPSRYPVAVAVQALYNLGEFRRVVEVASAVGGEATDEEAEHPEVRTLLAFALAALGRHEEFAQVGIEEVDTVSGLLARAMRANALNDAAAVPLACRALSKAANENERLRSLVALATLGEIESEAVEDLPQGDAALVRGVAALANADNSGAALLLGPHWRESPEHADYLSIAMSRSGNTADAVNCLNDAAEHFGVESLRVQAVEILMEAGDLSGASDMAQAVLARNLSVSEHRRLKTVLLDIAQRQGDWTTMETYARSLAEEFPDHETARWSVVYALGSQGLHERAWDYITRHRLQPYDEQTASMAAESCRLITSASERDIEAMAEIAEAFADSEQAAGLATIAAVMHANNPSTTIAEPLRSRVSGLMSEYVARHPRSDLIQAHSGTPEQLAETIKASTKEQAEQLAPWTAKVRLGLFPYGALTRLSSLSYAELLIGVAAGAITAIPSDAGLRERERRAAEMALNGLVVADTSAAAVCHLVGIDAIRISAQFKSVIIASELIADARTAVVSAKRPADSYVRFDHAAGLLINTEIGKEQKVKHLHSVEQVLSTLEGWQRVDSNLLLPPDAAEGHENPMAPWDAAVRVALDRQCPLWADDLVLRSLAREAGVEAFGTWALYEVLVDLPEGAWLPTQDNLKMELLRCRIAEFPISLAELDQLGSDSEEALISICTYLSRPHIWQHDLVGTYGWYTNRVQNLALRGRINWIPDLLYAASIGAGMSVTDTERPSVIGPLLGAAVTSTGSAELVPTLLAASRAAAYSIDPVHPPEPLPETVRSLFEALGSAIGRMAAAQRVTQLFGQVNPSDRSVVVGTIFSI
ncbi:MAG: DUF4062 domain-containing protein [bacterium]|nr:DUF4062 domain-containing protein [bacterium]